MEVKRCGKCKETKSVEDFAKNRSRKLGIHNECKACQVIYNRKWFLRKNYNIPFEASGPLLEQAANGNCDICDSKLILKKNGYAVDHCHTTGKIRGVLCAMCNTGIGHFKDNKEFLNKAIIYLEKYAV